MMHSGTCLCNIASCSGDPSRLAVSVADNVVRMVRDSCTNRATSVCKGWHVCIKIVVHIACSSALQLDVVPERGASVMLPSPQFLQVDLASMNVQCSVRGICCSSSTSCITVQPGTGNIAVASAAATLQLYDPAR